MKVRDGHARMNDDSTDYVMPSGSLEVIADDGRTLFGIQLLPDGKLLINAGITCKHNGVILDDRISIQPVASNCFEVSRPEYVNASQQTKKGASHEG